MSVRCLGKYVERLRGAEKKIETFPCPTCRSEFTLKSNQNVAELPSSYFIKNMLEIMAIQQKAKTPPHVPTAKILPLITAHHVKSLCVRNVQSLTMFG
jgi:hypothetical protein